MFDKSAKKDGPPGTVFLLLHRISSKISIVFYDAFDFIV